jgi:hypothetical protein
LEISGLQKLKDGSGTLCVSGNEHEVLKDTVSVLLMRVGNQ